MAESFTCSDCGAHVTNLVDGVLRTDRCIACHWIAENIPEGADRQLLRARLSLSPSPDSATATFPPPAVEGGGGHRAGPAPSERLPAYYRGPAPR
jgi:hypothetical protein